VAVSSPLPIPKYLRIIIKYNWTISHEKLVPNDSMLQDCFSNLAITYISNNLERHIVNLLKADEVLEIQFKYVLIKLISINF